MALMDRDARTEAPTPNRRREARRRGEAPRSADLNSALVLLAAAAAIYFAGAAGLRLVGRGMASALGSLADVRFDAAAPEALPGRALAGVIEIAAPLGCLALAAALLANFLQVGFLFSAEPLRPSAARIDPRRGLERIISLRGVARAVFGLLKIAAVAAVLVWTIRGEIAGESGDKLASFQGGAGAAAARAASIAVLFLLRAGVALLAVALLDTLYQRWQHERDLRMTPQEVREELLRMEGNPKVKERRRKLGREIALGRLLAEVPRADVVIESPGGFAAAIRYRRDDMPAPRCVAAASGAAADRLRESAIESGVPVVERGTLAREICRAAGSGGEIPPRLFEETAEVLAYAARMPAGLRPPPAAGRQPFQKGEADGASR